MFCEQSFIGSKHREKPTHHLRTRASPAGGRDSPGRECERVHNASSEQPPRCIDAEGTPGRMPPSRDRQTAARAPGGMEPTVPPSLGSRSLTPLVPEQVEAGALGLRPPAQVCLPSCLSPPELRHVVPRCGRSPPGDPRGPWGSGLLSRGACPQGRMLETREPTSQQSSHPQGPAGAMRTSAGP